MSTSPAPNNPAAPVKTLAIISISSGGAGLLLSFVSILCCIWLLSGPLGLTGVITGVLSLGKLKKLESPEVAGSAKNLAIGGICMGGFAMLISLVCAVLAIVIGVASAA